MSRKVLGDLVTIGLNSLANVLARRQCFGPQFRNWHSTNEIFNEHQQTVEGANRANDFFIIRW